MSAFVKLTGCAHAMWRLARNGTVHERIGHHPWEVLPPLPSGNFIDDIYAHADFEKEGSTLTVTTSLRVLDSAGRIFELRHGANFTVWDELK